MHRRNGCARFARPPSPLCRQHPPRPIGEQPIKIVFPFAAGGSGTPSRLVEHSCAPV
jgi:hypothetical protein